MNRNAYKQLAIRAGKKLGLAGIALVGFVNQCLAAGPDFTGMTSQVDWTTAIAAILLVAGGLAGVYVVLTGSGLINQKLKKGS